MTTSHALFTNKTQAIIYGLQTAAIQRMLDFDYTCRRQPSVSAVITEGRSALHKAFWGTEEILIPTYPTIQAALDMHQDVDVMINFASFRSTYQSSLQALECQQINTLIIIAEGLPEYKSRLLALKAKALGKNIIGPATVGGIKAGCFKAGNTAGTLDNIISCNLHRPGNVAFISKSGGMSNESYNIIARNTNGLYEGIALGGDRYPGSTFIDHALRWEKDPAVSMIVLLGEVGGTDEYAIADALTQKIINKPVVAWVSGTSAELFSSDVQFGHAGAMANAAHESATAKNKALKGAGAIVPQSFDDYGDAIKKTFEKTISPILSKQQQSLDTTEHQELTVPIIPENFDDMRVEGRVRKPTHFISTITDERSGELHYGNEKMIDILASGKGIGYVIGKLWFKKDLPQWATDFLEMTMIISADHGPAVAGAHNAIVSARAGKDMISSLASGLLTIGPRFGGALNDAGKYFTQAQHKEQSATDFVIEMKKLGQVIPGIGHRIYSIQNPDKRSQMVQKYARKHFSCTSTLDFALEVESITAQKRNNLILNVDGAMAASLIDMMKSTPTFTREEIAEIVSGDRLNAIFVLARTIGLIGHIFDQNRLQQPLYRHPWDDINYRVD
jgi:succinyl-CoA synthetase alpha subunit/citrate synthase